MTHVRISTGTGLALLARAITLIESTRPEDQSLAAELLERLAPHAGGAVRVGVTGAPGAGKSTFLDGLGLYLLECGAKVAVLAVDPSSQASGGSILGDKTRMSRLVQGDGQQHRDGIEGDGLNDLGEVHAALWWSKRVLSQKPQQGAAGFWV